MCLTRRCPRSRPLQLLLSATSSGAEPSVRVVVLPVVVHAQTEARHRRHALHAPRAAPGSRGGSRGGRRAGDARPGGGPPGGEGGALARCSARSPSSATRGASTSAAVRAGRRRRGRALDLREAGSYRPDHPAPRRRGAGRPLRGPRRKGAVRRGRPGAALQARGARAQGEVDALRSRVERLESATTRGAHARRGRCCRAGGAAPVAARGPAGGASPGVATIRAPRTARPRRRSSVG